MSRELDALDFIQDEPRYSNDIKYRDSIDLIRSALIEKEDLDNADPSEALTEIFNIIYNLDCVTTYEQDKKLDGCRKTIEKALFKAQDNENKIDNLEYEKKMLIKESVRDIKIIENQHKVLEIIKKKPTQSRFVIVYLKTTVNPTYEDYRAIVKAEDLLIEEEFNMLKEMFQDE